MKRNRKPIRKCLTCQKDCFGRRCRDCYIGGKKWRVSLRIKNRNKNKEGEN